MPRFRPVPLPIRTFRQAFDSGLGLRIYCPGRHGWRPIDLTAGQLDKPFAAGPRFVCGHLKLKVHGDGREICGRTGESVFGLKTADQAASFRRWADSCGIDWGRTEGPAATPSREAAGAPLTYGPAPKGR